MDQDQCKCVEERPASEGYENWFEPSIPGNHHHHPVPHHHHGDDYANGTIHGLVEDNDHDGIFEDYSKGDVQLGTSYTQDMFTGDGEEEN